METLRIFGIAEESIVDGEGLRFVVFTQGCKHNCEDCHNKASHDFNGGYEITFKELIDKIKKNVLLDGVTFSGGEPFEQAEKLALLASEIKKLKLNIWTYTGYLYEEILLDENKTKLLKETDVLVDGKFEKDKKSLNLKFKGSTNQRIINIRNSFLVNKIVLKYN